jgi:hypothetical protein
MISYARWGYGVCIFLARVMNASSIDFMNIAISGCVDIQLEFSVVSMVPSHLRAFMA